jgi:sigma-B regulation protein RsbU (phosphoserine phosphatase)
MKTKGKIIGVIEAINPLGRKKFNTQDLELFEIFADQAAISIENARLHSELVQQEKAKQELKIARQIQQNFLPDLTEKSFGLDIFAKNISAREVGGDFYDVIQINDSQTGIVIGDVSGKGVPASLYMVRAISDYRYLAPQEPAPSKLLATLNRSLVKDSSLGMFITLFYLLFDTDKQEIAYASAGHHPLLRWNAQSQNLAPVQDAGGMPLGLFEDAVYTESRIKIKSGDVFCLYTDGIIEARNKSGKDYELKRLMQCMQKNNSSAQAFTNAILQDVEEFSRGAEQHDDMTILTLMTHG